MRAWVVIALTTALGGCGGASPAAEDPAGGSGPVAFEPGPRLPPPSAGNPDALGYDYLQQLYEPLQSRWHSFLDNCRTQLPPDHELNQPALEASLSIGVARDGRLAAVRVVESSGNREFDDVALEVVRDAAPFPPPPASLVSDDGWVHARWVFARDRRQAGLAGASLERVQWKPARAVPMLLEEGMEAEAARRVAAAADPLPADEDAALLVDLADSIALHVVGGAMSAPDPALVRAAARAAADGRVASVAERLIELATGASDAGLRAAAVRALVRLDGPAAASALAAVVTSDDAGDEARLAAARGLAARDEATDQVRAVAVALARSDADDERELGLAMLAHVPASGQLALLERLAGPAASPATRAAALAALGQVAAAGGPPARRASKPLRDLLGSPNAGLRVAAADAVTLASRYGYDQRLAYWKVVELLKDRDERVRAAAVRASAALGRARFDKELFRLRNESSDVVLLAMAESLAAVGTEEAVARLASLAESEQPQIRLAAARSLAELGRGAAALRPLLEAEAPQMRAVAVEASDDVAAVEGALDDGALLVRVAAVGRLGTLRGRLGALPGAARLLATGEAATRVAIAGAWLGTRSPMPSP